MRELWLRFISSMLDKNCFLSIIILRKEFIQSIQQFEVMQEIIDECLIRRLPKMPKNIIITLIQFLDVETLQSMAKLQPSNPQFKYFFQLIRLYHFISSHLNKTDRSIYYTFYQNPEFKKLQHLHIACITEDNFEKIHTCSLHFEEVFKTFNIQLEGNQQVFNEVFQSAVDPWLPLPKLRRENVGIFCTSAFQLFLTDIKYGMKMQYEDLPGHIQELRQKLNELEEFHFVQIANWAKQNCPEAHLIKQTRYTPYVIKCYNMKDYLVKDNLLHNIIVCLFGVADCLVESSQALVQSFQDPFHQYVEFNLRYQIFVNFILQIEENFGFLFSMYGEVYQEVFQDGKGKPKFNFWKPALTKWVETMNKFHPINQQVYNLCLTQIRTQQAINYLSKQPDSTKSILNRLNNQAFRINQTETLYENCSGNRMEEYFQNNTQLYSVLTSHYLEYIIDISVNEQTVHWTGSSEQVLAKPYPQFESDLLKYNEEFCAYMAEVVGKGIHGSDTLKQLFRNEVEFLNGNYLKPVSLVKMIPQINERLCGEKLIVSFEENNAKLAYFNQKASILAEIAQNDLHLYQIYPLESAEKILARSVDTRHTDDMESSGDLADYFSEEEQDSVQMNESSDQPFHT